MSSKKASIPEIGKTYNYFSDGKVKDTALIECTVTDVVPFKKVKKKYPETYQLWCKNIVESKELYDSSTDYFVYANVPVFNITLIFVRMVDGNWFSFNSNVDCGILDVDGTYYQIMQQNELERWDR